MNILKHPIFNIPNLLTASNFLCGIGSIISCFSGRMDCALMLLVIAMVCDFLDGFAARLLSISNNLGKQLDSLADLVSFGIAPGIFMMFMIAVYVQSFQTFFLKDLSANEFIQYQTQSWLSALFQGIPNDFDASIKFLPLCALMIPFFSLFRLAKFNIDERQTDKFLGTPTPFNTMFFMFFPLHFLMNYPLWSDVFTSWYAFIFNPYVITGICLLFPLLLISEIPLMALKFKSFGWRDNKYRFILLISCAILLPILLVWSIPIIVLLYLILSFLENTFTKIGAHEI